jgi:hypothetical protein
MFVLCKVSIASHGVRQFSSKSVSNSPQKKRNTCLRVAGVVAGVIAAMVARVVAAMVSGVTTAMVSRVAAAVVSRVDTAMASGVIIGVDKVDVHAWRWRDIDQRARCHGVCRIAARLRR